MRKRVGSKTFTPNIDYVAKLAKEYGFKRSTIMSYWKDAVKQLRTERKGNEPSLSEVYREVSDMIELDLNE